MRKKIHRAVKKYKLILYVAVFIGIFSFSFSINYGFNVRGTTSPEVQFKALEKGFSDGEKEGFPINGMWVRINGGTLSQITYPGEWKEEWIEKWAEFQKQYGFKYIFVINLNDRPDKQWEFYNKFKEKGVKFSALEFGNENYLQKYSGGPNGKDVTERTSHMTAQKYLQLTEEYLKFFSKEKLIFLFQVAPEKKESDNWNEEIFKALNSKFSKLKDVGIAIHLYEKDGENSLNANQIEVLRGKIPLKTRIAVTEFGISDKKIKSTVDQRVKQELKLTRRIKVQLNERDILLNQVLYNNNSYDGTQGINDSGLTSKGRAILKEYKD